MNKVLLYSLLSLILFSCAQDKSKSGQSEMSGQNTSDVYNRTTLPILPPELEPITEMDARKATAPKPWTLKAPKDAPNVVIVLIDDLGFGQSSAFGGPVRMPVAEKLATHGIRYNRFHTTALCSPTRTALLTGRNHHTGNMGAISETATAFPGNTGIRPRSVAPLAEILRLNGYSTGMFGKNHETAAWEVSVSGPFDRWPDRQGFEKFYGFMGGETNQFYPGIYDGNTKLEIEKDEDYHFSEDMTDKAIQWVRAQQSLTPDKPFFMYYAPGATHAPHQVPESWKDRYKGEFDKGWDYMRETVLAKQVKMGLVPEGTILPEKDSYIKDWDKLSNVEKKVFARQMEIFAAFGEHIDTQVGRLVDAMDGLKIMENTVFIYILGDNGASAEGMANGLFNENTYFNGVPESMELMLKNVDKLGGPESYNHFAAGWAVAGNTPFKWTKQVASNFGGTRNGLIIHWPNKIKTEGEIRNQFHHVIDIAPTILEAAHLPEPTMVNGVAQKPIEGVSMLYSLDDKAAAERHETQYFEIIGNRGIYHEGWFAGTVHKAPWEANPSVSLEDDKWELYDTNTDFSLANDLAAEHPEKLEELKNLFLDEGVKYNVLPIDDRSVERFDPVRAGRPDLMGDRKSLTVYPGMNAMMENAFISVKNKSFTVEAEVELDSKTEGVILAQGGQFGGWALYVKNSRPMFTYNWVGLEEYEVNSSKVIGKGKHLIKFDFDYDGGVGKGGKGTIFIDGKQTGSGTISNTNANMYSLDEGADVGFDEATPVSKNYKTEDNEFTGTINKVTVSIR